MKKESVTITSNVMDAIKTEEVSMHSRRYFMFLSGILVVSIFMMAALTAISISIIVDDIQAARNAGIDRFGNPGRNAFIHSLPWLLMLLSLISFGSMLILVRRFDFSYKHKFWALFAATMGVVVGFSVVLSATGAHHPLSESRPLRPFRPLQRLIDEHHIAGEVLELGEDYIILETPEEEYAVVHIDSDMSRDMFEVGEFVGVFGERDDDGAVFNAEVIRSMRQRPAVRGVRKLYLEINNHPSM